MGTPVMIRHADGSETPAHDKAIPLFYAEQDANAVFRSTSAEHQEYAIVLTYVPETETFDATVTKIGEDTDDIPAHIIADAEKAVKTLYKK